MSRTELGSPIGPGLADWDLEAFWRARAWAADKGEEAPDAKAARGVCLEDADPASPCDDKESFWDAASTFSEDGEASSHEQGEASEPSPSRDGELGSGERDGKSLPMAELIRGKGEERENLSALSLSGSEDELDRWMLGSRSQTTEESAPGSAASSTLDSAEWGVFDLLSGASAPASGNASPLNNKEMAAHQEGEARGAWGGAQPASGPVLVCDSVAQVSGGALSSAPVASASGGLPSRPGSLLALSQQDPPADGTEPGASLDRTLDSDLTSASQLTPDSEVTPVPDLTPVSDLIPDSDLARLLQVFGEEEADMIPMLQGGASTAAKQRAGAQHTCEEARPSARADVASPGGTNTIGAALEAASGSTAGSTKTARGSTGAGSAWRLLMRRNSELMQYTSWVRDRGRHFGAMEFRGRMLLLPDPAAATQVKEVGTPTAHSQKQWGEATVRDFLLDELHRAEWDESREASEVLEEWDKSGRSTARWVRKLPLFLRSREYVVRRRIWSPASTPGVYYCISKSTEHPAAPQKPTAVRVSSFFSSWRVRTLSREETEQARQELASSSSRQGGRKARSQVHGAPSSPVGGAEAGAGPLALEIITHYEEESGMPRDLVRMGVAHSMWGHMVKMELALRSYCAAGRSLRHLLPASLFEAEQLADSMDAPFQLG